MPSQIRSQFDKDLKETVSRETTSIPIYTYYHVWKEYDLYLHWHSEFELLFVTEGVVRFTIDTVPIEVSAGECVIISPGQLHSALSLPGMTCVHSALLFDSSIIEGAYDDYCQSQFILPLITGDLQLPQILRPKTHWESQVLEEVKGLFPLCTEKSFGWELAVKASLYKVLALIALNGGLTKNPVQPSNRSRDKVLRLKKALDHIEAHYTEKIYIEDLSAAVQMNPHYFCRFFKANTGKSPIDYLNQYRVEQAARLLESTSHKISEICYEVGFENFSYFIKKFKAYKNCTPNCYRKNRFPTRERT